MLIILLPIFMLCMNVHLWWNVQQMVWSIPALGQGQDCRWRLCTGQRTELVQILWLSPSHHFLYILSLTIFPSDSKCTLKWQINLTGVHFLRIGDHITSIHHFRIIPIGHNENVLCLISCLKHVKAFAPDNSMD